MFSRRVPRGIRSLLRRALEHRACEPASAAVQKHVAVLERAGLVTKRRKGREHLVAGNPAALRAAHEALDRLELLWRDRVSRMDDLLAADPWKTGSWTTRANPAPTRRPR